MSNSWQEFDVAVGGWRLAELAAEQLPVAAEPALSVGCETQSLVRLAAMDPAGCSELEPWEDLVVFVGLSDWGSGEPGYSDHDVRHETVLSQARERVARSGVRRN